MKAPSVIEINSLLRPVAQGLEGFLGAVLLGSVSAGMQDETSDYDVQLIFTDEALKNHPEYDEIDLSAGDRKVDTWANSISDLKNMDPADYEARDYVHAVFLMDKTGQVKQAVRGFVEIPADKQRDYAAQKLDGYFNGLYRSLKCRRKNQMLGYYAMAAEEINYYNELLFAVNGTIAPFINRAPFLLKKLEKMPAPAPVISGMMETICKDARVKMQIALFDLTCVWTAQLGYAHVLEAWEGVLEAEVDKARKAGYQEKDCHDE